jgi:aspartate/glutamate racemase
MWLNPEVLSSFSGFFFLEQSLFKQEILVQIHFAFFPGPFFDVFIYIRARVVKSVIMKTVVAVHTALAMVEPVKKLFADNLPEVRLINIVDDSLIQDVIREGKVPDPVRKRLFHYYDAAVETGADVIFNTCSSVGDVAIEAREKLPIPLVKIDDAMARKAVQEYSRIGVMATLPTTLDPTRRLIERFASEFFREVEIVEGLAEGAFQSLMDGDPDRHDRLVLQTAVDLAGRVDAFVLAQGSMARVQDAILEKTGKAVLTSPLSGTLEVRSVIEGLK